MPSPFSLCSWLMRPKSSAARLAAHSSGFPPGGLSAHLSTLHPVDHLLLLRSARTCLCSVAESTQLCAANCLLLHPHFVHTHSLSARFRLLSFHRLATRLLIRLSHALPLSRLASRRYPQSSSLSSLSPLSSPRYVSSPSRSSNQTPLIVGTSFVAPSDPPRSSSPAGSTDCTVLAAPLFSIDRPYLSISTRLEPLDDASERRIPSAHHSRNRHIAYQLPGSVHPDLSPLPSVSVTSQPLNFVPTQRIIVSAHRCSSTTGVSLLSERHETLLIQYRLTLSHLSFDTDDLHCKLGTSLFGLRLPTRPA